MSIKFCIAIVLYGSAALSYAQADSGGVIKLVVPFPAGNSLDAAARSLADGVAKELRRTVVVENRAGASGSIAAARMVTNKESDAFLFGTTAMMAVTPYVMKTQYSPSDFTPVAKTVDINTIVTVPAEFPAKTWQEFVQLAKRDPGKYSYATPGPGTIIHLSMELLQAAAGIRLLHVPYRDTNAAVQDFLGGRVDIYSEPVVIQFIQSGKARGLGVMSNTKIPQLPDVPALGQLGVPIKHQAWLGVFAPKSVDPALIAQFEKAVQTAVASPEFRAKLLPGLLPAFLDGKAFAQQISQEQVAYRQLISDLKIKVE